MHGLHAVSKLAGLSRRLMITPTLCIRRSSVGLGIGPVTSHLSPCIDWLPLQSLSTESQVGWFLCRFRSSPVSCIPHSINCGDAVQGSLKFLVKLSNPWQQTLAPFAATKETTGGRILLVAIQCALWEAPSRVLSLCN